MNLTAIVKYHPKAKNTLIYFPGYGSETRETLDEALGEVIRELIDDEIILKIKCTEDNVGTVSYEFTGIKNDQ